MTEFRRTYTCAGCHGDFEKTRTEEECLEEVREVFGREMNPDDDVLVCDDCFQEIMGRLAERGFTN